jgi:DNA-binding CsgD family transcriptional regulator
MASDPGARDAWFSIALFAGILLLLAVDLGGDLLGARDDLARHLVFEIAAGVLALAGGALFVRRARRLRGEAETLGQDLARARAEAQQALAGPGAAIGREFDKWALSEAEREVALLLLKGLSHKEIAARRRTGEGTVRQQAQGVYRKAGLEGRSHLAAFFLDGLALPRESRDGSKRS